jgi:hypothetical protein
MPRKPSVGPQRPYRASEIKAMRFSCANNFRVHYYKWATDRLEIFVASDYLMHKFGFGSLRNKNLLTMTPKSRGLSEVNLRPEQCPRCLRPGRGPGYGPDSFPRNALSDRRMSYPYCSGQHLISLRPTSLQVLGFNVHLPANNTIVGPPGINACITDSCFSPAWRTLSVNQNA